METNKRTMEYRFLESRSEGGAIRKATWPMPAEEYASAKVEETLKVYNDYFRHFVEEEELRCRGLSLKDKLNFRKRVKRPDLKAISKMKQSNSILYPKRIGSLEGINVGFQFFSRAEMVVVGLHSHWMNGIDFLAASCEYKHYRFPFAISIVMSGEYSDDIDNLEEVIYTGEGGNNFLRKDRQHCDQTLTRGNLALKNSMEQQIPVRVTRGNVSTLSNPGASNSRKVYTYDGLYRIAEYWEEQGQSRFTILRYRLKRLPGQPPLTTRQVHFARESGSKRLQKTNRHQLIRRLKHRFRPLNSSAKPTVAFPARAVRYPSPDQAQNPETLPKPIWSPFRLSGASSSRKILKVSPTPTRLPGTVMEDISEQREKIPIPATNLIDEPPIRPTGFRYCNSLRIHKDVELPNVASLRNCDHQTKYASPSVTGINFSYEHEQCDINGYHKLLYQLEVFRTPKKQWAVRSLDPIPAGTTVCECTGELKRTGGLTTLGRCNFVIGIDWLKAQEGSDGSNRLVPRFCIDARKVGNVARFINPSCRPNVFLQLVLGSDIHGKLARIFVIAANDIAPLKELTYDSSFAVGSFLGHDGRIRRRPCYCGEPDCRWL
ncbi:hypothetical protein H6P81_020520 [Aristolochia fimbriata]|uniref:YDG domain-containing protein n=1 Tax=Aristolochia fimbriata TaxID=158543 RepID=A0AAV7DUQ0_ARIFI|nr:hypothetical protein H6P81_020520 [Aristolochia fimbriata]